MVGEPGSGVGDDDGEKDGELDAAMHTDDPETDIMFLGQAKHADIP